MEFDVHLINDGVAFWHNPAWIGSVTGLVALGFSFYNLRHQRETTSFQIKASIKEKLINDFKENLSSFLTSSVRMNDSLQLGIDLRRDIDANIATQEDIEMEQHAYKEFTLHKEKALELTHKISLFLDEENKVHAELIKELRAWSNNSSEWEKEVKKHPSDEKTRNKIRKTGVEIRDRILDTAKKVIVDEMKDILPTKTKKIDMKY